MMGAGIPHEQVLVDGRPAPDLSSGATVIVPYADNLNVIGVCKGDVVMCRESRMQLPAAFARWAFGCMRKRMPQPMPGP